MTILFSRKQCSQKARAIENEIRRRFDWIVKVHITQEGRFSMNPIQGNDRKDLYPNMSRQQADQAIINDITAIFQNYIPNATLTDYEQGGIMHYPTQLEKPA